MNWTRSARSAGKSALLIVLIVALPPGCARKQAPGLRLEQNLMRISLAVSPDGIVSLSDDPPLFGRLDVGPILAAEGTVVSSVQLLARAGQYYLWADGFRNVWEVTPKPGSTEAGYRPLPLSAQPLSGVRLAHYGSAESTCVRLDAPGHEPWFISPEGTLHASCP